LAEEKNLLKVIIGSLTTMAEFMFHRQGDVPLEVLNDLAEKLRRDKRRKTFETLHEEQRVPRGMGFAAKFSDFMNETFRSQLDWGYEYEVQKRKVPIGSYYAIGGVAAIRSILALGLTLNEIYLGPSGQRWDTIAFKNKLEYHAEMIRSRIDCSLSAIGSITSSAGGQGMVDEKLRLANEDLYPLLRTLLA
jgi:hypothetical protein